MSRQRGARSRSRSRDSFDRGRGPIINTPERDLALSGLSSSEKECMLACLSVEMGWMQSLPSHQQPEELINKLDDLFHFIDNGYIVDDWSPPPNSVETISQFFTLMNEVREFYDYTLPSTCKLSIKLWSPELLVMGLIFSTVDVKPLEVARFSQDLHTSLIS